MENLAKFVCWSIMMRIPHISLHEPNGHWKKDQEKIGELIESCLLREGVPEQELQIKAG